jgi:hypothetical protein
MLIGGEMWLLGVLFEEWGVWGTKALLLVAGCRVVGCRLIQYPNQEVVDKVKVKYWYGPILLVRLERAN